MIRKDGKAGMRRGGRPSISLRTALSKRSESKGRIYVLSAPSGTGKTTLCKRLLETTPHLVRSVSVTTRPPRPGEREGRDYFFISPAAFERLQGRGDLLEWTTFARACYGTPRIPLERSLKKGKDVILLLDVAGARALKKRLKKVTTIFLLPPSLGDLEKRLAGRRTERTSERLRRLRIAEREMREAYWYDYVVINDDLRSASLTLQRIVKRGR